MKIVKTYMLSHLAHLDLAKLNDEGIEAYVKDDNYISINPVHAQALGGIKLLVHDQDYTNAIDILKRNDFQYLKNEFPDEEIDEQRKCGLCESINIIQKGSWLTGILFLLLFFVPVATRKEKYICLDCSNEWSE